VVGLRDQLNQRPAIAASIVGGVVLLLLLLVFMQVRPNRPAAISGIQNYFSVDDGHTWFPDSIEKIAPFDHSGSEAVLCHVFQKPGAAPFAGYLEKYTPEAHDQLTGKTPATHTFFPFEGILVKRPGDKTWIAEQSAAGQSILKAYTSGVQPVLPSD
jgi:hypothetical protein